MRRIAALLLVLGCAANRGAPTTLDPVRVDGSTGVMPLVKALAAEYQAGAVMFGGGLGTSARVDSLKNGRIDMALASHGLVIADIEAQGLKVHKIADMPVGFGVHSSVGVTSLTRAQVCDIYAGRVTNWRQVGGPDLAIAAATRPRGEVDGDVATAHLPCLATPHSSVVSKQLPPDMNSYLASTPGAIGMTTSTVAGQSGGMIKLVALDGVSPTPENVRSGRYAMTRESFIVTRAELRPAEASFLDFIRSSTGARIITASGAIPR